jgi:uncharacterized protein (TIGR02266 family)
LDRAVQLKFGKFQDFLTEIAGNISPGGMFVRSDDPLAIGERFEFQCELADGYPLVSGQAEVVWVRHLSTSVEEPCGMGARFLQLWDGSEELIRRIVEERIKAGESTYDLEVDGKRSGVGTEEAEPFQQLSEEILAVTSNPVEEEAVSRPPEEPATELPVEKALDEASLTSSLEAPHTTPTKGEEPEVLTIADEEPVVPVAEPASSPLSQRPISEAATPPLPDPVTGVGQARSPRRRIGFGRLLELLLIAVPVGFFLVLLLNQLWARPQVEELEGKLGELTGSSRVGGAPGFGQVDPVAGADEQAEPSSSSAPVGASGKVLATVTGPSDGLDEVGVVPAEELVREVVQKWAGAWSGGRVGEYLSYYSAGFLPASGGTRAAWEARRRERLLRPGSIRVAVVSVEVERVSASEMRVTFTQSYQSDTFRDRVRKTLRMVSQDGAWKIAEELVVRQLPW